MFNPVAKIQNHKFNKISIFHNVEDTTYSITVSPEQYLDTCIINYTTGASEFYFTKDLDSVNLKVIKQDTTSNTFYFYGAYLENSLPGINYTGIGINGASTHSYLKAELFKQHLLAVNPDLVILSVGVNDASGPAFSEEKYVANYKKIIDIILEVNPDCAIILTTNNDFYNYRGGVNQHFDAIYSGLKTLASTYGGSVWNMYRVMGGYQSINLWKADDLASRDRIHFTRDGYRIIAGLLFDAILKDYEQYLQTLPKDSQILD
jgi:lysophospholipase L1-like esterase